MKYNLLTAFGIKTVSLLVDSTIFIFAQSNVSNQAVGRAN
jgi:hypothetical protein